MNTETPWIEAAALAGLITLLVGILIAVLLPERLRNHLRRHPTYRVVERGWARLRVRRQAIRDGQRFRNLQTRFLSCMHRPKGPPSNP